MTINRSTEQALQRRANHLLHHSGFLPAGTTLTFQVKEAQKSSHTQVYFLETDSPLVPNSLMMKTSRRNQREVAFYQAAAQHRLPIVPCYGADIDSATGETALLMGDLSETHAALGDRPIPASAAELQAVVEALASVQAFSWQGAQGGLTVELPAIYASRQAHEEFLGYLARDADCYLRAMQGKLSAQQAGVYSRAIEQLRNGWEHTWQPRLAKHQHLALIHGDLHPGNVFTPTQSGGAVCFIDWEAYRLDLPTSDLVMLLALHLAPGTEEALPLLRAYHARLAVLGVSDYSFEDVLRDYRTAILYGMFYPMKLFAMAGVHDEEMIANAQAACERFACLTEPQ